MCPRRNSHLDEENEETKVVEAEGQVTVETQGAKGTFRGRLEREGQRIRLLLP